MQKRKQPIKKIIILIVCLAIMVILGANFKNIKNVVVFDNASTVSQEAPNPERKSMRDLISASKELNYKQVMRNPDKYINKPVTMKGTIVEVTKLKTKPQSYSLLLDLKTDTEIIGDIVTNNKKTNSNLVQVTYSSELSEDYLSPSEILVIYGYCQGVTQTYSSQYTSVTVPSIKAEYIF